VPSDDRRHVDAGDDREVGEDVGADGKAAHVLAAIPDRCYSTLFQASSRTARRMAPRPEERWLCAERSDDGAAAEEYARTTRRSRSPRWTVRVVADDGTVLLSQRSRPVTSPDVQVKDEPIQDWVKLGVRRARLSSTRRVWLDAKRATTRSDRKVEKHLKNEEHRVWTSASWRRLRHQVSLDRNSQGLDTISVTGNVLRDYLTISSDQWSWVVSQDAVDVPLLAAAGCSRPGRRFGTQACRAVPARRVSPLDSLGESWRWPSLNIWRRQPGVRT